MVDEVLTRTGPILPGMWPHHSTPTGRKTTHWPEKVPLGRKTTHWPENGTVGLETASLIWKPPSVADVCKAGCNGWVATSLGREADPMAGAQNHWQENDFAYLENAVAD